MYSSAFALVGARLRAAVLFVFLTCSALLAHEIPSFDLAFYPGQGSAEGNGVAVDSQGNIYATGQYNGSAQIGGASLSGYGAEDFFLASFTSNGVPRWGVGAGTSSSDYGTSVKVASNGDLIVSASIFTPVTLHGTNFTGNGGRDAILARYTSSGTLLWAKTLGGSGDDEADQVTVDSNGNIIIVGRVVGTVDIGGTTLTTGAGTNRIFVAKFDGNGNVTWAKSVTSQTSGAGSGVTVDGAGNVYVTGNDVIAGQENVTTAKYNSAGNLDWKVNHPGSGLGTGVGVDSSTNIYVCGTFSGESMTFGSTTLSNANFQLRGFVLKYDPSGNVQWADRVGGRAYRLAVLSDGSVFASGFFVAASGNFASTNIASLGQQDGFITKHNSSGELLWVQHAGSDSRDILRDITADESNVLHVVGEGTTAAFDLESFPTLGSAVVARLDNKFTPKYVLTRTVSPSATGSIIPSPQPYANNRYFSNTVVQLTATPGFGRAFAGWGGDASGNTSPITITMDAAKTVIANFTNTPVAKYTLTTNISPAGAGSIVASPGSANNQYDANSIVQLTAVPAAGKGFAGWTGPFTSSVNPANLFMTTNQTITANFTNIVSVKYTLTRKVPSGGGSIAASPPSADGKYDSGTVVTLTAVPATGKAFAGWSGAVSGSVNPIDITMSTNRTVNATFTNIPVTFLLTTNANPLIGGVVTVTPGSSNNRYASNALVTAQATPNYGYRFVRWMGASTATTNRVSFRMTSNRSITALFTNLPVFQLTTTVTPPTAGSVVASPESESGQYPAGTVVTLTAMAEGTNLFSAWTGSASSISNQVRVTMNGNKTVTALFNNPGSFLLQRTNGQLAVWFMQNTQRLGSAFLNNGTPLNPSFVLAGTGHFDGNGWNDLLLRGLNGSAAGWLMNGNERMSTFLVRSGLAMPLAWRLAAVADMNQDESPDLLWQNTNGKIHVWFMNGVSYTNNTTLSNIITTGWRLVAAADFNTNGSPDLLFQHSTGKLALWLMDGVGRSSSMFLRGGVSPGLGWRAAVVSDVDGDGHPDIVFQHNDGRLLVWFFNSTDFSSATLLGPRIPAGWFLRAAK